MFENLFGESYAACDFVDLVQNGFCIRPVAPLQGLIWAPFCGFDHWVSASHPLAKQVLKVVADITLKTVAPATLHDKKVVGTISTALSAKISAMHVMPHPDAVSFFGEQWPSRKDPESSSG